MTPCDCSDKLEDTNWRLNEEGFKVCIRCGGLKSHTRHQEVHPSRTSTTAQRPWYDSHSTGQPPRNLLRDATENVSKVDDLVKAINRTTHAVRAFVLFLFYQLTALTLAFFTYWLAQYVGNSNSECSDQLRALGACSPNSFLMVIAFLIWVIGVIYSSNVGWTEIKKSAVPESGL